MLHDMRKTLLTGLLVTPLLLSGCTTGDTQSGSAGDVQQHQHYPAVNRYNSTLDQDALEHFVFIQKLPDGRQVYCVAEEHYTYGGMSCDFQHPVKVTAK